MHFDVYTLSSLAYNDINNNANGEFYMNVIFDSYESVAKFSDVFGVDALHTALKSKAFPNDQKRWIRETLDWARKGSITLVDFDDGNNWKHVYLTFNTKAKDCISLMESIVLHIDTGYGCTQKPMLIDGKYDADFDESDFVTVFEHWSMYRSINGVKG